MAPVYPPKASGAAPRVWSVAALFARGANLTFGGGSATAETLRREVVEHRQWMSEADFRLVYAASRVTPGTNLLALCTAMGWRLRGIPGALIALLAASIPSALILVVAMIGFERATPYDVSSDALRGAVAVSIALLFSSAWALVRPHVAAGRRGRALVILVASWGAQQLGASALVVLAIAAALGASWPERPTP